MIKRGPTRIEMNLEDLKEFDAVKKEIEKKKKEKEPVGADSVSDSKTRQKEIQERIGYDPKTVPSTSSRIGELRGGV
ncbi:anaphase-promoting complex subunit CDC26-like [Saccoglossus kowalevskii]|uniref:Anaphase-promoting complex subunit CDC26 n=1 Tax=Saccoglossus kowalevskii TaxID=10224 RepID=A0ABM0N0I4_SACKO|nr:PREDICTED: anaphase-promoting complex subunit CDC26-like [Saccoglossus kowalevskii]